VNSPQFLTFDGSNVWITNYATNSVTVLRASDGSQVGIYGVGINPLGVTFDGANIWVVNPGSNTVNKL
jgi:DNA-binding beta-propeller fold protein YncE